MHSAFCPPGTAGAVPIHFIAADTWPQWRDALPPGARAFAVASGFEPKAGRHLLLPGDNGLSGVVLALETAKAATRDLFLPGALPAVLPRGVYRFANAASDQRLAALAFALGTYRFQRYRKPDDRGVQLRHGEVQPVLQGNDHDSNPRLAMPSRLEAGRASRRRVDRFSRRHVNRGQFCNVASVATAP